MLARFFSRWMDRHISDGYVKQSIKEGYRSRSAYKLLEINQQASILTPGMKVLDLGSSPGGWSQVALEVIKKKPGFQLVSVDILPMSPIDGCTFLRLDMLKPSSIEEILRHTSEKFDAIICDMSCDHSGIIDIDCMGVIELNFTALQMGKLLLKRGGSVLMKVLTGSSEPEHFVSFT